MRAGIIRLLCHHPLGWGLAAVFIFWVWGGMIPRIDWNAIEMMIGRNLLQGNGLVVAPGDPPAIWRPALGSLLCAFVELFTSDPFLIFRVLYTASLTTFLVCMFYAARALWGLFAAHMSAIFILTSGALTARLVTHPHGISHVAFLLVAGPAVLCSILAVSGAALTEVPDAGVIGGVPKWRKPKLTLLFAVGLCWGLAYLARWETLLFFVVTLFVIVARLWYVGRSVRACFHSIATVLGFALLFVPNAVHQKRARANYGITGPSAISTFYASEGWVGDTKDEDEGFLQAVKTYGPMEANGFSVLRTIAHHPGAFLGRLRINVPQFLGLFTEKEFFDPVWLFLLAGFACDRALFTRRRVPVAWLALLCMSSATVCIFQIDPRYLVISLPGLLLLICGGAQGFANRLSAGAPGGKVTAHAGFAAAFGAWMAYGLWRQMGVTDDPLARRAGRNAAEAARELAAFFHGTVKDARPAVLTLDAKPMRARIPSMDELLLSYYAGTGIAWEKPGAYPRDQIFSWKPKRPDYFLVQEEALYTTSLLLAGSPLGKHQFFNGTSHYLLRAPEAGLRPPDGPEGVKLLAILNRDYPVLVPRFLERTVAGRLKASLTFVRETRHEGRPASATPAGLPAGHRDLLFRLSLRAEGDVSLAAGLGIRSVELRRQKATRLFASNGEPAMLLLSAEEAGSPMNSADGSVPIPLSDKMELWLRICDDGRNAPDATYRCRVRIGETGWIISEPVSLH